MKRGAPENRFDRTGICKQYEIEKPGCRAQAAAAIFSPKSRLVPAAWCSWELPE